MKLRLSERSRKVLTIFLLSILMFTGVNLITTSSSHAYADPASAQVSSCKIRGFLGLEPWYQYLGNDLQSDCEIKCFNVLPTSQQNDCGTTKSDIPLVLLAVVDDLLRIAGLVAVIFVFYGAFKYVASQGSSDATAEAQSTIINALIGVGLASIAVVLVNFIGNQLGG
jgi:hypothetical protein